MDSSDGYVYDDRAERALLGAIFVDQTTFEQVAEIVTDQDLYVEAHRTIFRAMLAIHKDGADVDGVTVAYELKRINQLDQIGGAAYLDALIDAVAVASHPVSHAHIVARSAKRRRIKTRADALAAIAQSPASTDDDIERVTELLQREVEESTHELPSITAAELLRRPRRSSSPWLIRGWWTVAGCGVMAGHPKSNKSVLTLAMTLAVSSGREFVNRWPVEKAGPVVVVNDEDNEDTVSDRLVALGAALGVEPRVENIVLSCQKGCDLSSVRGRGRLAALVRRVRPVLTILDCWRRLARGVDENSSKEVSEVLGWLRGLQAETTTAICLVHHFKKDSEFRHEHITHRARGSIDFAGWYDDFIGVERMTRPDHEHHVSVFHRSQRDLGKQRVHIQWDEEHENRVKLWAGEPIKAKPSQTPLDGQGGPF